MIYVTVAAPNIRPIAVSLDDLEELHKVLSDKIATIPQVKKDILELNKKIIIKLKEKYKKIPTNASAVILGPLKFAIEKEMLELVFSLLPKHITALCLDLDAVQLETSFSAFLNLCHSDFPLCRPHKKLPFLWLAINKIDYKYLPKILAPLVDSKKNIEIIADADLALAINQLLDLQHWAEKATLELGKPEIEMERFVLDITPNKPISEAVALAYIKYLEFTLDNYNRYNQIDRHIVAKIIIYGFLLSNKIANEYAANLDLNSVPDDERHKHLCKMVSRYDLIARIFFRKKSIIGIILQHIYEIKDKHPELKLIKYHEALLPYMSEATATLSKGIKEIEDISRMELPFASKGLHIISEPMLLIVLERLQDFSDNTKENKYFVLKWLYHFHDVLDNNMGNNAKSDAIVVAIKIDNLELILKVFNDNKNILQILNKPWLETSTVRPAIDIFTRLHAELSIVKAEQYLHGRVEIPMQLGSIVDIDASIKYIAAKKGRSVVIMFARALLLYNMIKLHAQSPNNLEFKLEKLDQIISLLRYVRDGIPENNAPINFVMKMIEENPEIGVKHFAVREYAATINKKIDKISRDTEQLLKGTMFSKLQLYSATMEENNSSEKREACLDTTRKVTRSPSLGF